MHTPTKSIVLFLIASVLGAFGQYLYKKGAQVPIQNFFDWATNWRFIIGIICYIGVMVLFVTAFKIGGELTVLYPIYASTFIWALFIGIFMLKETITLHKIIGVVLIILGMFFIAKQ